MGETRFLVFVRNKNFWFALSVILFSLLIYLNLNTLGQDAAFFPKILVFCLFIIGLLIIFNELKFFNKTTGNISKGKTDNENSKDKPTWLHNFILITALILVFLLIDIFGFYFTLLMCWLFIHFLIKKDFSIKSIFIGCALGVLITLCLIIVFDLGLGLPTPTGLII